MVSSIHSLERGGVNMPTSLYEDMKRELHNFGEVDVGDFCVHYLAELFKQDDRQFNRNKYKSTIDELQFLVDNLASYLHTRGETWE